MSAIEGETGVAFLKAVEPGLYDAIIVDSSDPIGESTALTVVYIHTMYNTNIETEWLESQVTRMCEAM